MKSEERGSFVDRLRMASYDVGEAVMGLSAVGLAGEILMNNGRLDALTGKIVICILVGIGFRGVGKEKPEQSVRTEVEVK